MKSNRSRSSFGTLNWALSAFMLAMILAFSFSVSPSAQAATSPDLAFTALVLPSQSIAPTLALLPSSTVLAVTDAPAASPATDGTTVAAATPWYTNGTLWTTVLAVVAGIFGLVRNAQLSTHQKINAALVLGIEQAAKIPEVAAFEDKIKATIQGKAESWGVQPLLDRIVQDLTAPTPTDSAV